MIGLSTKIGGIGLCGILLSARKSPNHHKIIVHRKNVNLLSACFKAIVLCCKANAFGAEPGAENGSPLPKGVENGVVVYY